jgi:hypothetical protein
MNMVTQWLRAHGGAGWNGVLRFQPSEGLAGTVDVSAAGKRDTTAALSWLDRLDRWFWRQEQKRCERYLAQASDVVELEQRLRELERRPDRFL